MNVLDLLKGRKVKYMTDAKIEVELEIKEASTQNHSYDLEPATRENDWWPATRDWTTITVHFTNGFTKSYDNINQIKLVE